MEIVAKMEARLIESVRVNFSLFVLLLPSDYAPNF
jgi:hypothetical protein